MNNYKVYASEQYVEEKIANIKISGQKQVDWNQNDETAADFIKNRPFGETGEFEEIELFNQNVAFRAAGANGEILTAQVLSGCPVVANGITYKIIIGTYEYVGQKSIDDNNSSGLGNESLLFGPFVEGEPFYYLSSSGVGMFVLNSSFFTETNLNIVIYQMKPIINSLPRKFIEEYSAGYKANIQNYEYDGQIYNSGFGAEIFNNVSNKAIGDYSHAEGNQTKTIGSYSHAEGSGTEAVGMGSHAEGSQTKAIGVESHAEGFATKALGDGSHAEGSYTEVTGDYSHAEGWHTIANTPFLHVQGLYNIPEEDPTLFYWGVWNTIGNQSYDGKKTVYIYNQQPSLNKTTGVITAGSTTESTIKELKVGDYFSFTDNANSIIDSFLCAKEFISSEGDSETNNTLYTWRFVRYEATHRNTLPGKYLHIVGNGNDDKRSNAHTLDWSGNAWFAGDVYVGSASGTNQDEGSKKLATEEQIVGKKTEGTVVTFEDKEYTCGTGAEIFNDLSTNLAIGKNSHAEGSGTIAVGMDTHAEGCSAQAIGNFSHAENGAIASGTYSHAEGQLCEAKGGFSHAEGLLTEASADTTHAEGIGSVAMAYASHVQGMYNEIDENIGKTIYAEALYGFGSNKTFDSNTTIYVFEKEPEINRLTGEYTTNSFKEILAKDLQVEDMFALSNTNITQYYWLKSIQQVDENQITGKCMTIGGTAYSNLGKYAHIVGNGGSAHARSNAHTLDWDGNAWYQGSVECTSLILKSSTEGSNKRFRITIDDNGELHTLEITE